MIKAIVVMGVAGCGKTTVGELLAQSLGWEFLEGDSVHPPHNIELMSAGIPLSDEDRIPWLVSIGSWMRDQASEDRPVVVTCSALARRYRDRLRSTATQDILFAYLQGDRDTIELRISARSGHFMKAGMLDSQFAALEPPQPDELHVTIDLRLSPTDAVAGIRSALQH